MATLSCSSEIVEATEDFNVRLKMEERVEKHLKLKPGQICSIRDDISQLFEAIDIKTSRSLGRKSAMKRPMRPGLSQASCIGFSGSVTLKQALRGSCISQASEMATMKRLSKQEGSSRTSKLGSYKRLYREVVAEAGESGFPLNEGKDNLVEMSLVAEVSTSNFSKKTLRLSNQISHTSTLLVDAPTPKIEMTEDEIVVPLTTQGGYEMSMEELGKNGKPTLTHSFSSTHTSEKFAALDEIFPASAKCQANY